MIFSMININYRYQ